MNTPRTTIILVRHGECSANIEERFRGRCDFELNELGRQQAEQIASALQKLSPTALYSSPLRRAVQSLEPAARALGLELRIEEDLTNISLGAWEGRKKADIAREQPELWDLWKHRPEELSFPGMESLDEVGRRARAVLDRLVQAHAGETIALCTHRTVLKPLVPFCLETWTPGRSPLEGRREARSAGGWFWKFHFDTASLSLLVHDERGYSLFSLNRIDHLTQVNREWN
ncbi:MAG: histidine phosphatase family protein [Fretibacterium sp.]|nr:histidine phosphatase family protein [Fretibacterium sp.]